MQLVCAAPRFYRADVDRFLRCFAVGFDFLFSKKNFYEKGDPSYFKYYDENQSEALTARKYYELYLTELFESTKVEITDLIIIVHESKTKAQLVFRDINLYPERRVTGIADLIEFLPSEYDNLGYCLITTDFVFTIKGKIKGSTKNLIIQRQHLKYKIANVEGQPKITEITVH